MSNLQGLQLGSEFLTCRGRDRVRLRFLLRQQAKPFKHALHTASRMERELSTGEQGILTGPSSSQPERRGSRLCLALFCGVGVRRGRGYWSVQTQTRGQASGLAGLIVVFMLI